MTNAQFEIDRALKAAQWERAKGELRALVALHESYSGGTVRDTPELKLWKEINSRVKTFINAIDRELFRDELLD